MTGRGAQVRVHRIDAVGFERVCACVRRRRLLRLRRASSHPEGFDLAPGSPLTPGWPRVGAADRQAGD